jgi:hypothetical protein
MAKLRSTNRAKGVTIKVDLDFPTDQILDGPTVDEIGETIKDMSIKFMEAGVSPVDGKKFEKYKDTEKYPKNVRKHYPDKKNSPVNLKLSGNLYESLNWIKSGATTLTFGLLKPKGKADIYGEVHNEGLNGVAERKFLPTAPKETFNRTILLEIQRLIAERISKIIKK